MVAFPLSKINLGLHVLAKRSDGYHDLDTCFYPLPLSDIIEIIPADRFDFASSGLGIPGNVEDNLAVKAYRLLQEAFSLPSVSIHLHKIIPPGSGLGGGSADAVAVLKLLNDIFELSLTANELQNYALKLGSDCPFFVKSVPVLAGGRGELMNPVEVSLSGKYIFIIIPDLHISTADAFSGIKPKQPQDELALILQAPLASWKNVLINDFEKTAFEKYPILARIKADLYKNDAEYASMTGSGSTIFGIFNESKDLTFQFSEYFTWGQLL